MSRPTLQELGIFTGKPKHPEFASLKKRRDSFETQSWPTKCPISVEQLALAGFWYTVTSLLIFKTDNF